MTRKWVWMNVFAFSCPPFFPKQFKKETSVNSLCIASYPNLLLYSKLKWSSFRTNNNRYRVIVCRVTLSKIYPLLLIHWLLSFQKEAKGKVSIYHNNLALNFSSQQSPIGRMTFKKEKHTHTTPVYKQGDTDDISFLKYCLR